MSTGVQHSQKKRKVASPISLQYNGKESEEDILSYSPKKVFIRHCTINGSACNNMLFYGDNLDVLAELIKSGYKEKINLIYIDPPFSTASNFISRDLRHAYSDLLCGGEFVEFLRKRLILLKELLSNNGSIYLHLDSNMAFTMKLIMDEIFGEENFRAFITRRKCSAKNATRNTFGNVSDYILFYSKTKKYTWNRPFSPWEADKLLAEYPCIDAKTGRRYKKVPIHAPGVRNGKTGEPWRGKLPPKGKHWQYTPEKLDELDAAGEIYWSPTGNPRRKVFYDNTNGVPIQDIWTEYRDSVNQSQKTTGYPTEKNYDMLKMIVEASSNPGDLVLDCFAGSGTTLEAAFRCGRKWIGVDNSIESMKAIRTRFIDGLESFGDYVNSKQTHKQNSLPLDDKCEFEVLAPQSSTNELSTVFEPELQDVQANTECQSDYFRLSPVKAVVS